MAKPEAVAYHAAGHAVMAFHLRRGIKYVTIESDERAARHLQETKMPGFRPDLKDQKAKIEDQILISLAGPQAEKMKTGRWNSKSAAGDYQCAVDLGLYVCPEGGELNTYLRWLGIRCARLVELRWREIEALAAELLVHKRLGARRIRAIIKAAQEEE
jgi:hypothetical protein